MLHEKKLAKLPELKKEPRKAELTDRELAAIAAGGKGGGGGRSVTNVFVNIFRRRR
jgi:hypothetical protein